jgi:RNA polymerase primary sigma factor
LVLAAKARDPAARDALIERFQPLIGSVARRYRSTPGVSHAELMQEGVVGVLRALGRYDPDLGTPFWAYASWWVRQAMQQVVAELTRPVVLSDRAARQLARVRDAERVHLQAHGRVPSARDLADDTGLSCVRVDHLLAAERTPRSLDSRPGWEDGPGGALGERLADERADESRERALVSVDAARVPSMLAALGERERTILRARFGMDGPEQSLRELGSRLGVTAERIRQIQDGALEKLRRGAASGAEHGSVSPARQIPTPSTR